MIPTQIPLLPESNVSLHNILLIGVYLHNTASNEHSISIASYLDSSPKKPEQTSDEDGVPSSDFIRQRSCEERAHDRASSQSGTNCTLNNAMRIVKVGYILGSADDS